MGEDMPRINDDILSIKGQLHHISSQADIGVDGYKAYMTLTKDYLADQAQFWAAQDDLKTLVHSLVEDCATHHQPQDWDNCLSTVRAPDGSHMGWDIHSHSRGLSSLGAGHTIHAHPEAPTPHGYTTSSDSCDKHSHMDAQVDSCTTRSHMDARVHLPESCHQHKPTLALVGIPWTKGICLILALH
jgi:hypothetical protein